jgi:predicted RNase H-like HicB family nuclease
MKLWSRCQGVVGEKPMNVKVIVHAAEEGGYWAEVPAIPGCATQGETRAELISNLREAIEGCLSLDVELPVLDPDDQVLELAL